MPRISWCGFLTLRPVADDSGNMLSISGPSPSWTSWWNRVMLRIVRRHRSDRQSSWRKRMSLCVSQSAANIVHATLRACYVQATLRACYATCTLRACYVHATCMLRYATCMLRYVHATLRACYVHATLRACYATCMLRACYARGREHRLHLHCIDCTYTSTSVPHWTSILYNWSHISYIQVTCKLCRELVGHMDVSQ